jgi:cyclin B
MRKTLVSWLMECCLFFRLQTETWYITINIIDRYCDARKVSLKDYQLLGVTALLIASKFEEITPPSVKDLVKISANAYTREDILKYECMVLQTLEFDFTVPTTHRFIERFCNLVQTNATNSHLAQYIGELSMLKLSMNKWQSSRKASASIYLARKMQKMDGAWPHILQNCTNYTEKQVRDTAKEICKCINNANRKKHYDPIYKKYRTDKYNKVADIPVMIRLNAQKAQ